MKSIGKLIPFLMFSIILFSCGNSGDGNPVPTIKVISSSISDNAEVDASSTSFIKITYSVPIKLGTEAITLNGAQLIGSISNMVLNLPVNLIDGTNYTLSIPAKAILMNGATNAYAPSYTLHFSTKGNIISQISPLTNASPSKEAKNVYDFLISQFGKKTLSGAMADVNNNNKFADWVFNATGKYPALTCYDFVHLAYSPANWIDYSDISPATTQWQNNGLVAYMWHWNVPSNENDPIDAFGFYTPNANNGKGETSFDIREALKDGTWQNKVILKDIEKVAGYLKLLQDKNIPVIWRPLHEAAGNYRWGAWFWWGRYGTDYTKQLWKLLYDKLVKEYKLNNLIWVWTVQVERDGDTVLDGYEGQISSAYPGDDYVDIVAADIYASNNNSQINVFNALKTLTQGKKLIALAETGIIQDPDKCFAAGDTWSWFMEWYANGINDADSKDAFGNTKDYWKQIMNNKYIINRENMPNLK